MDPNAALAAIRQAVDELGHESSTLAVHQLVENSRALDEWLSKGGLLPDAWAPYGQPPRPWAGLHQPEPEHLIASTAPITSKETHQP